LARLALGGLDGAASIGLVLALIIALAYGVFAGLRGVVWTDLFQFSLAMIGAVALAVAAYDVCGGAAGVVALLDGRSAGMPAADLQVVHALAPFAGSFAAASAPPLAPPLDLVGGHGDLVLTALLLSWWATKNADGGGVIIQRLLACKSRRDATWAMGWFTAAHYLLRPWAWLAVGLVLAAVFALPPAQGFEGSYPDAMLSLLPPGVLGLALGGMVAALVSTADTHLHWGASYLANDLLPEGASDARRLWWSRAVQPLLAIVAAVIAANLSSIAAAWKILFVLGAGLGAPTLLRWFVGAIDARGELAAFATSSVTAAVVLWGPWPRPSFAVQMAIVGGVGLLTTVIAAWKFPGDHRRAARFMALTDAAGARWWRPCFGALVCLLCAAACGTRALAGEVAPLALMVLSLSAYALLLYRYGAALPQEGS
jgi:Na+/proline symporter